jgi:hypothetical protein
VDPDPASDPDPQDCKKLLTVTECNDIKRTRLSRRLMILIIYLDSN